MEIGGKIKDYKVGTGYQAILKMALPIAFAIVVPQLNFVINNIFIGHFLPDDYLGIAAITGVYYLIFAVVGNGLNNGLQALIARRAGENRIGEIGLLFNNGVIIGLFISALGILTTYLAAPYILHNVLGNGVHADRAIEFLKIRIWGLPFFYVYQLRNALLVGTNNSKILVLGTIAETCTNIFFDYSLITGAIGFAKLGFNGAAYASVIAEVAGLLVMYVVMRAYGISRQLGLFKNFGLQKKVSKLILVQSLPLIMQYGISIISWEFFYILIERNNTLTDLAISNSMRNVFGLFGCFGWAFASASNAMVSNVIGQQRPQDVLPLIRKIALCSFFFVGGFCVLLNIFPHTFFMVYGKGEAFVAGAVSVTRVVTLGMVLMSVATVWLNAVVGTGNSKINLISESVAIVVYCAYVWVVLEVMKKNILYGWMSEWIYWIVLFLPSYWYMKSGKWKGIKL